MQVILIKTTDGWRSSRYAVQRFLADLGRAVHGSIYVVPPGVEVELLTIEGDTMPPVWKLDGDRVEILPPPPQPPMLEIDRSVVADDAEESDDAASNREQKEAST